LILGFDDIIARLPQSLREACAVSFELTQGGIAARLGGHAIRSICSKVSILASKPRAAANSMVSPLVHGQPSCGE